MTTKNESVSKTKYLSERDSNQIEANQNEQSVGRYVKDVTMIWAINRTSINLDYRLIWKNRQNGDFDSWNGFQMIYVFLCSCVCVGVPLSVYMYACMTVSSYSDESSYMTEAMLHDADFLAVTGVTVGVRGFTCYRQLRRSLMVIDGLLHLVLLKERASEVGRRE